MKGFLAGSFALIIIYVVVGKPGKIVAGEGIAVTSIRHFLSPQVAAIPQRKGLKTTTSSLDTGSAGGVVTTSTTPQGPQLSVIPA